jgi:glycosyltransferase involved in cell wall biosynthesis
MKKSKIKDYEIMIYNDGSTDKTEEIAKKFLNRNIFLFSNKYNQGWVKMYENGVKKTSKDYLIFAPADNAYSSKKLVKFFKNYYDYDCIYGHRKNYYDETPYFRKILSKLLAYFTNFLLYKDIKDLLSMHIYKKKILRRKIEFTKGVGCWLEVQLNVTKRANTFEIRELYLTKGHSKNSRSMSFKNQLKICYSFFIIILLRIFHIRDF